MIKNRPAKHVRSYLQTSTLRKKRRRKRLLLRVFWLVFLIGIVIGFISLLKLQAIQVDEVQVNGAMQISPESIKQKTLESILAKRHWFGLVPNSSSFFVDEAEVQRVLVENFPAIDSVTVDAGIGGTVSVDIVERNALALWCDANLACYKMDLNGLIFDPFPYENEEQLKDFVIFKGMIDEANAEGITGQRFLSGKEISAFLETKKILNKTNRDVEYIRCESQALCLIKIAKNGVLRVDPAADLNTAFDRLNSALTSPVFAKSTFEYIDLRFGNKLFYRLSSGEVGGTATSTVKTNASSTARIGTSTEASVGR